MPMHLGIKLALDRLNGANTTPVLDLDFSRGDYQRIAPGSPTITQINANNVWTTTNSEGDLHGIQLNELPIGGLRRARNRIGSAAIISGSGTLTDMGSGVWRLATTAANTIVRFGGLSGGLSGTNFVTRMDVRRITGSGTVAIDVCDLGVKAITSVLETSFKTFSTAATTVNAYSFVDLAVATSGDIIEYRFPQLQDKTGTSDPTVPDEYVDPTVNYGFGAAGIRYYAATNGTTVDIDGVVTEGTGSAITTGYLPTWEAASNKSVKNNKLPADTTTNCTTFDGGTGATFAVVNDLTELQAAGLSALVPGGIVLRVIAGTGFAGFDISGDAANVNAHSLSVYVRCTGGSAGVSYSDGLSYVSTTSATYVRVTSDNVVPTASTRKLRLRVAAGTTAYFILWQMTETKYTTALIPVAGSAVSRTTLDFYYPAPSSIIRDFSAIKSIRWKTTPALHGAAQVRVFEISDGTTANALWVYRESGSWRFRLIIASAGIFNVAVLTDSPAVGSTYKIGVKRSNGQWKIFINGVLRSTQSGAALSAAFVRYYPATSANVLYAASIDTFRTQVYPTALPDASMVAATT